MPLPCSRIDGGLPTTLLNLSRAKKFIYMLNYVEMRAEQLIAAENAERKIAVEIKSLVDCSNIDDLE